MTLTEQCVDLLHADYSGFDLPPALARRVWEYLGSGPIKYLADQMIG
jgi:hypothetical protein